MKQKKTSWTTYVFALVFCVMGISILLKITADSEIRMPSSSPLTKQDSDDWTNSSVDTRGMTERERIELFHKFIFIEDRYPGDKTAQRPYKQELYDEYGIDEKYEIKLLGEAIDSKWPLPPE